MKCRDAVERVSSAVEGLTRPEELAEARRHIDECSDCALRVHQLRAVKATLGALPRLRAPEELTMRLRVAASRHLAERRRWESWRSAATYWFDVARVWCMNLMRPVAIPAAGGLLTAVLLFSMLAPTLAVRAASTGDDVPTILSTEAAVKQSILSFGVIEEDIVVDVLVDDNGRMIDYSAPPGQVWQYDPRLRRFIENTLLCTQFTPATTFGQPRTGKVRITLRGNSVEVRG